MGRVNSLGAEKRRIFEHSFFKVIGKVGMLSKKEGASQVSTSNGEERLKVGKEWSIVKSRMTSLLAKRWGGETTPVIL